MDKFVFIDLDDTILDFARSERHSIELTLKELGLPCTEEYRALYSEINLRQWKLLEKGETTRPLLRLNRFALFFREIDAKINPRLGADIYEGHLSECGFTVDGAIPALERLKEKYKLYIASNGIAAIQKGRIERSGIKKYFDDIFVSERIGYSKPDKRFFEVCFSLIPDFNPSSAVIVGDSLTSDISGGKNAGIKTVLFDGLNRHTENISPMPDTVIHSLYELDEALERLFSR